MNRKRIPSLIGIAALLLRSADDVAAAPAKIVVGR